MPATPIVVLLLFALSVQTFPTFEVPQTSTWAMTETHGLSEATADSSTHAWQLPQMLRWTEETVPQPASSFGLSFDSGAYFNFGRQEIGILASSDLFMVYNGPQPLKINDAYFVDKQYQVEVAELEEYPGMPFTMHSGQRVKLTIQLFPRWIGVATTYLVLNTSTGQAFYVFKAFIQPSPYLIHELVITSQESATLEIYNPMDSPMFIVDVFKHPSNSPLKVPSFWQFSKCRTISAGSIGKLTVVGTNATTGEVLGMVVVMTNGQKFAVPVTVKSLGLHLTPEKVNFGVVTTLDVRHLVPLVASNYHKKPITVLNITASHESVQVLTHKDVIQPWSVEEHLADLIFQPIGEAFVRGFLTIVTNLSTLRVSFQGFSGIGFVNYDAKVLTFSQNEMKQPAKSLVFSIANLTSQIRLLSAYSQTPGLSISALNPNQTISSHPKSIFKVQVNELVPVPQYSFVVLETALGAISLPVWFQKLPFTCVNVLTKKPCGWENSVDLGTLPVNETKGHKMKWCNGMVMPLQLRANARGNGHIVRLGLRNSSEIVDLIDSEGRSTLFYPINLGECIILDIVVITTDNEPGITAQIRLNQYIFNYQLTWKPLTGEITVLPHSVELENVFIGKAIELPILIEHTFSQNLALTQAYTNLPGLHFRRIQQFVPPSTPTNVWNIRYPWTVHSMKPVNYSVVVTIHEVKEWQDRQAENSKTVEGLVTLQTDLIESIKIPITAQFRQPKLAVKSIDFGVVGVGEVYKRYIRVTNVGDEWIHVQLLLLWGKPSVHVINIGYVMEAMSSTAAPIDSEQWKNKGNQCFYLSSEAREIIKLKSRETAILGPVLFLTGEIEKQDFSLYIRNNLTFFEEVELRGSGAAVQLSLIQGNNTSMEFDLSEDVKALSKTWKPVFTRKFTLQNRGNQLTFIKGLMLNGQFCAFHEFEVLNCNEEQILPPNATFDIYIRLRPTFSTLHSSIDLWILTSNGEFKWPISMQLPAEGGLPEEPLIFQCVSVLSGLLMTFVGMLLTLLGDCIHSRSKLLPLLPKESTIISASGLVLPGRQKLRKRRKKKQESARPVSPAPDHTGTTVSSKEEVVQMTWEKAEERTLEIDEARENEEQVMEMEEDNESLDDGFLDDYRETSGLFMGFRTYAEEEL